MPDIRAFLLVAAMLAAAPVAAETGKQAVDLELVLAVDVSGSVDSYEAQLQRDGYVQAILDPNILLAIQSGVLGRIAATYIEWAGFDYQRTAVEWTLIHDAGSARAFAKQVARAGIITARRTSISALIAYATSRFDDNGFAGTRLVIDISGDGPNNSGNLVAQARDATVAAGITINGLPILNDRPNQFGYPIMKGLDLYYRKCVIGGPGAFMVVAENFEDFAEAIRSKLILEIAGLAPAEFAAPPLRHDVGVAESVGCDAGERQLRQFQILRGNPL